MQQYIFDVPNTQEAKTLLNIIIATGYFKQVKMVNTNNKSKIPNKKNININDTTDWWDTISEIEKQNIEIGLKQLDAGENVEYKDIKQKVNLLLGRQ